MNKFNSLNIGLGILLFIVIVALLAPFLNLHDPLKMNISLRFAPLGTDNHLLGTDNLGRDLLSRFIWGARPSIIIGLVPVVVGIIVSTILGSIAGYMRGWPESIIMRGLDVILALPPVFLAITIAAILGAGLINMLFALTFILIPPMTRVVYQEILRIKNLLFIDSAKTTGAGTTRIIVRHILPNSISTLLAYGASVAALGIVLGAGLSFIGLGIQPPDPDWGQTINGGRSALLKAPHVALLPGLGIFVLSFSFNLIADGLRDINAPTKMERIF